MPVKLMVVLGIWEKLIIIKIYGLLFVIFQLIILVHLLVGVVFRGLWELLIFTHHGFIWILELNKLPFILIIIVLINIHTKAYLPMVSHNLAQKQLPLHHSQWLLFSKLQCIMVFAMIIQSDSDFLHHQMLIFLIWN